MQTPTTTPAMRREMGREMGREMRLKMRRVRRSFAAATLLVLALSLLPWGGTPAHAHASLIASEPGAGANLATAPETLRLTFNEDVTLLETTRLTGPGGEIPYSADVDGGLVELRPDVELEDGRWDLVWQIVSADGHLVGGVIPFSVGDAGAQNDPVDAAPGAGTGEASTYTTMTPTDGSYIPDAPGVLDRLLELIGWLAAIAALGVILAGRGTLGAALGAGAATVPLLRIVDAADRWGANAWRIGETRAAAAAVGAGTLLFAGALLAGRARTGALTLAVLTWAAQAFLSGHPNTVDPRPLYAALSALHLAGALTWSGAVTAALVHPGRARHASRIATLGIALLLPGAILLVTAFVPAALSSGAGRWEGILAAKAALVLGALALGWRSHHACRCGTCHRSGCDCPITEEARHGLRRRAAVETALIAVVAVLSATLTTSIPARLDEPGTGTTSGAASIVTVPADAAATTTSGTGSDGEDGNATSTNEESGQEFTPVNAELLFENGETGELLLEVGRDGSTTIHLVLRDPEGNPFTAEQLEYELENPGLGIAGIAGQLPVSGAMHMGETVLPGGGTWRIHVNATYDTFTTVTATTEFETAGTTP